MDDINFTDLQTKVCEMILVTPAPGKHSARSAISHLKKAWKLQELDPEMAVFRIITGEEESVSAIFHSLHRLRYIGAEKLNPKNHVHKSALQPFLNAIENNFNLTKLNNLKPTLELDINELSPKFKTRISIMDNSGNEVFAYPVPPLNFSIKQNGKVYNFEKEILQITNQQIIKKVTDYIRSLANERNRLLYSSNRGIPEIRNLSDKLFFDKRDRIFRNLILYLLIDPYPIQTFVQQALDAFLEMLGLLPEGIGLENG
jgi:hypothetical protein